MDAFSLVEEFEQYLRGSVSHVSFGQRLDLWKNFHDSQDAFDRLCNTLNISWTDTNLTFAQLREQVRSKDPESVPTVDRYLLAMQSVWAPAAYGATDSSEGTGASQGATATTAASQTGAATSASLERMSIAFVLNKVGDKRTHNDTGDDGRISKRIKTDE